MSHLDPDPRDYPLPRPGAGDDPRFTRGLMLDVADVLTAHGYPRLRSGRDYIELQQALFRFLYATETPPREGGPHAFEPEPDDPGCCRRCLLGPLAHAYRWPTAQTPPVVHNARGHHQS